MSRLSMAARKRIKKTNFAKPEKAPKSGSYPIHDRKHAGLAIAFARMHGHSGVVGKACARFPSLPACKARNKT